MKNIKHITIGSLFLVLMILSGGIANTIDAQVPRGDLQMEKMNYASAAKAYERVLQNNPDKLEVWLKVARAYSLMNNVGAAADAYEKAGKLEGNDLLDYIQVLMMTSDYDNAKKLAIGHIQIHPEDTRFKAVITSCDTLILKPCYYIYDLILLPEKINSGESNFGAAFYKDGILYSSEKDKGVHVDAGWTGRGYLDIKYSEPGEESDFSDPEELSGKVNSMYHEGVLTTTSNGKTMYFTRNNYKGLRLGRSDEDENNLKLFSSELQDGEWKKVKELPWNSDDFSTGHPTLGVGDTIMYLISDRPGGHGGTDLYVSYLRKGEWTNPSNMGTKINTPGNEMFPFWHAASNRLYFSSDGHPGLGGLDIFFTRQVDGFWELPTHIECPLNSPGDDFNFILNPPMDAGYMSSNRDNLGGIDKIYRFSKFVLRFEGTVVDKETKLPVPFANVRIESDTLENPLFFRADNSGFFTFVPELFSQYDLEGTQMGYESGVNEFGTFGLKKSTTIRRTIELTPILLKLEGKVIHKETREPLPGAMVTLFRDREPIDSIKAGSNGEFAFPLDPGYDYRVVSTYPDFFTDEKEFSTHNVTGSKTFYALLEMFPICKPIIVHNIYYDFDKWDIRPDAAAVLDSFVRVLKINPQIKEIELGSHTDSRGSFKYNERLSMRRAESAVRYMISKGIESNRLTAAGYGEYCLLLDCPDGVECTDDEHQQNRRTEFLVTDLCDPEKVQSSRPWGADAPDRIRRSCYQNGKRIKLK